MLCGTLLFELLAFEIVGELCSGFFCECAVAHERNSAVVLGSEVANLCCSPCTYILFYLRM